MDENPTGQRTGLSLEWGLGVSGQASVEALRSQGQENQAPDSSRTERPMLRQLLPGILARRVEGNGPRGEVGYWMGGMHTFPKGHRIHMQPPETA